MATEHTGIQVFQGDPVTLLGEAVEVGDNAPAFSIANGLGDMASLADYAGKTLVLSVVPCLDTGVCDAMGRRFSEIAAGLGDDVAVVVVSMDLPPAQERWCGAADVDNVTLLSDYRDHSFGLAFGIRIKEFGLLARSVWVIDGSGVVRYKQIVPEFTDQPDYGAAISAISELT